MIFKDFLAGLAVGVLAGDFVATICGGTGKFGIALPEDDDFRFLVRRGAMAVANILQAQKSSAEETVGV